MAAKRQQLEPFAPIYWSTGFLQSKFKMASSFALLQLLKSQLAKLIGKNLVMLGKKQLVQGEKV